MKFLRLSMMAFLAALLRGQTTWIVDNLQGPGSQFVQVQAAVQAAAPGDTILVRFGSAYPGFTVDKPLRIVGLTDSGGNVPWTEERVEIVGVPAGACCGISNFVITRWPYQPGLGGFRASASAGRIHLDRVGIYGTGNGIVQFVDCADVLIHASQLSGTAQPVLVKNSSMRVGFSVIMPSLPIAVVGLPLSHTPAGALHVDGATVVLQDVLVWGIHESVVPHAWPPTPGLTGQNATVICGPWCSIRGGPVAGPWSPPLYTQGITSFTGTLIRDPSAQITPPNLGTVQTRYETYVDLVTRNETFRVHVKGPPNGVALVAASFAPQQPWSLRVGDLWLDLNTTILLGAMALDAMGWSYLDRTAGPLAPIDQTYVVQAGLLDTLGAGHLAEPMFFAVIQ